MNVLNRAQISRHEVIVLILSVFVLVALLVRTVIPLSPDNNQLLDRIAVPYSTGVGSFGTSSGFIAKFFVEDKQQQIEIQILTEEVCRLREKIHTLEKRR